MLWLFQFWCPSVLHFILHSSNHITWCENKSSPLSGWSLQGDKTVLSHIACLLAQSLSADFSSICIQLAEANFTSFVMNFTWCESTMSRFFLWGNSVLTLHHFLCRVASLPRIEFLALTNLAISVWHLSALYQLCGAPNKAGRFQTKFWAVSLISLLNHIFTSCFY